VHKTDRPTPHHFNDEYQRILSLYQDGKYSQTAKETNKLLFRAMSEVYKETRDMATPSDRKRLQSLESRILKTRPLEKANLKEIATLIQEGNVFSIARGAELERTILKIPNLPSLVALGDQKYGGEKDRELDNLRKCVFTLLQYLAALMSFKGWVHNKRKVVTKQFDLDLNTGIMTNPEDRSRNISFKAATFGAMLAQIYSECALHFRPVDQPLDSTQTAHEMEERLNVVIFKAGFNAGSKFGDALSKVLAIKNPQMAIDSKIDKWCQFDTNVGWGRFENHLSVNESTAKVTGKIVLKSNFLVTEKTSTDPNICSLMTGYIAGVLQGLIGIPVHVEHFKTNGNCAQFNSKKKSCDFVVS